MTEYTLRQRLVVELREHDPISVENPAHPGTPDLNLTWGWIELKWAESWPVGEDTPLRLPHYTQQQKVWGVRRRRRGGEVYLLLQVGQEFVLLDAVDAARVLGSSPRRAVLEVALASGSFEDVAQWLKGGRGVSRPASGVGSSADEAERRSTRGLGPTG